MGKVNVLKFGADAKHKLLGGVEYVHKAVSPTMGPKGHSVLFSTDFGGLKVTKDGVTVAKSIESTDKFEQLGIQLVQGTISACADKVADGSSTTTVVTCSAVRDALLCPPSLNRLEVMKGVDIGTEIMINKLKEMSVPLDPNRVYNLAFIASNGNDSIAQLVAEAYKITGSSQLISVEDSKDVDTKLKVTEGFCLDKGLSSHVYATDRQRGTASLSNGRVLICAGKVSSAQEMLPVLERCAKDRKPLLLYADVEGEAKNMAALNKHIHQLPLVILDHAGFGDSRENTMVDFACASRAKILGENREKKLSDFTDEDMGYFSTLKVGKDKTLATFDAASENKLLQEQIKFLESELAVEGLSDWDKEKNKKRLMNLKSTAAVVYLGAYTEVGMKDLKDSIDDTMGTLQASEKRGVIAGGGVGLLRASGHASTLLSTDKELALLSPSAQFGMEIICNAALAPCKSIVHNAKCRPDVVVHELLQNHSSNPNIGFDVNTREYVDMYERGILDSALSSELAIGYASKACNMAINLHTIGIKEKNKDEDRGAVPQGGGMPPGGGGMPGPNFM